MAKMDIHGVIGKDVVYADLLAFVQENEGQDLEFYINSVGGSVDEAFKMANLIESVPQKTTAIALTVQSAANLPYFACQVREAEKNAEFMMHGALFQNVTGNSEILREYADMLDRDTARMFSYISQRTGIPERSLEIAMSGNDTYITAEQAEKIGFLKPAVGLRAAAMFVAKETFSDYPEAAKKNARRALKWLEENDNPNDCLTRVGFARANQLADGEALSLDVVSRMAQFERHQEYKDVPYEEGCGGIAWDAWGGTEGIEWAQRIMDKQEEKAITTNTQNHTQMAKEEAIKKSLLDKVRAALGMETEEEEAKKDEEEEMGMTPEAVEAMKKENDELKAVVAELQAKLQAMEEEKGVYEKKKEEASAEASALTERLEGLEKSLELVAKHMSSNAKALQPYPTMNVKKEEVDKEAQRIEAIIAEKYGDKMKALRGDDRDFRKAVQGRSN